MLIRNLQFFLRVCLHPRSAPFRPAVRGRDGTGLALPSGIQLSPDFLPFRTIVLYASVRGGLGKLDELTFKIYLESESGGTHFETTFEFQSVERSSPYNVAIYIYILFIIFLFFTAERSQRWKRRSLLGSDLRRQSKREESESCAPAPGTAGSGHRESARIGMRVEASSKGNWLIKATVFPPREPSDIIYVEE